MKDEMKDIEIRSGKVRRLIDSPLHWVLRYGTSAIFIVFILLAVAILYISQNRATDTGQPLLLRIADFIRK